MVAATFLAPRQAMLGQLFKNARNLTIGLLAATICISPWLFGGVLASHQVGILIALWICLVVQLCSRFFDPKPAPQAAAFVLLLLAAAVGFLQQVPLPRQLAEKIAPTSAHWWTTASPQNDSHADEVFPVSVYPGATRRNLAMLVMPVATVAIATSVIVGADVVCVLLGVFALNGALFALFGLAQLGSFNGQIYWSVPLEQGGGPFAAFVNRNHAGAYLNLCFAAAIGFLIWVRDRQRTRLHLFDRIQHRHQVWIALGLASLCATGVVCTLSRGAVVSFVGAAVLVLVIVPPLRQNQAVRNGILTTATLGILAATVLGQGSVLSERFEGLGNAEGRFDRIQHWRDVADAIPDYWRAGSGIGTYRFAYRPYEKRYTHGWFHHAENQYFEALIEAGAIGLGLMLVVLFVTWRAALRAARNQSSPATVAIGAACLFAVVAQTIHAAFDFNLYMPAVGMLFAFFVAAAWKFGATRVKATGGVFSALALLVTIGWAGWSLMATTQTARGNQLQRELGQLDRSAPIHAGLAERYLEKLKVALAKRGHAELQLDYAELLLDRFRGAMTDELTSSSGSSEQELIWNSTLPAALHARYFELRREGRSFAAVTNSPSAQSYLMPAFQAALDAARACPLSPSAHVLIAQLAPLAGAEAIQEKHEDLALQVAPFNPAHLFAIGLLDLQAGRQELGCQRWRACLEISVEQSEEIVRVCLANMSSADFVDQLMPRDVGRAVDVVKRHFADPSLMEIRHLIGRHLQNLDASGLRPAKRAYVDATIRDLLDEPAAAAAALEDAVKQEPMQIAWRFELARLLVRIGRLQQSRQHALICIQMAPNNQAYAQFLVSVEARLRNPGN